MPSFKNWLYHKFLPSYCRDDLLAKNAYLDNKIGEQNQEIERLNAYIRGLEAAFKRGTRIIIYGDGVKKN